MVTKIEKSPFRSPVLALARKMAGGSHNLIFNMYERYQVSDPVQKIPGQSKSEKTIREELAVAVTDNKVRAMLIGEFRKRIASRIERKQQEGTSLEASAFYALLALWTWELVEERRVVLSEEDSDYLFDLQVAADRLRQTLSEQTG